MFPNVHDENGRNESSNVGDKGGEKIFLTAGLDLQNSLVNTLAYDLNYHYMVVKTKHQRYQNARNDNVAQAEHGTFG